MFVTSTSEVLEPSADKLISVALHQCLNLFQLLTAIAVVIGQPYDARPRQSMPIKDSMPSSSIVVLACSKAA